MATKVTASAADFSLSSNWECEQSGSGYVFAPGKPTWENHIAEFKYNLPSGAVVSSSVVYARITSVYTGYSVLNANGNGFRDEGDGVYSAPIELGTSKNGINVGFNFKANGKTDTGEPGNSLINFTDVYLEIEYTIPETQSAEEGPKGLTIPPQSCCIYNQSNKKVYMFDGVLRIQHQTSLKIEEEPDTAKHSYVNNALNEPDKLTLDVIMSDVYSGGGAIEGTPSLKSAQNTALKAGKDKGVTADTSRSANAYGILKALKEGRKFVSVITPQYVYVDMLISSMVVNQEEASPYSWTGQIVFQKRYDPKPAPKASSSNSQSKPAGDNKPTNSFISGLKNLGASIGKAFSGFFGG